MGGSAFSPQSRTYSGPPIDCIRIPTSSHPTILSHISSLISPFFESITSPKPAPGKKDHGDIDILAYNPIYSSTSSSTSSATLKDTHYDFITHISTILNATAVIRNVPTTNFAVYIDLDEDGEGEEGGGGEGVKGHVQVDLHICPDITDYTMTEFCHAYGDSWNILNTCVRDVGLSVNGEGLRMFVYHDDDGDYGGAKEDLVLTTDTKEILKFWGLDTHKWEEGFNTQDELFAYLRGNRFFRRGRFERERLVYRDKKRLGKRRMFMEFVEGYTKGGERIGAGVEEEKEIDVESVRREAVDVFEKEEEYRRLVVKMEAGKEEKRIWQDVATAVTNDEEKEKEGRLLVRALKREFERRYGSEGLREMVVKQNVRDEDDLKTMTERKREIVSTFVEEEKEGLMKGIKEELEAGTLKLKKPKNKNKMETATG